MLLCLPNTIERDDKNAKTERLVIEDLGQQQRIVARVHDSSHLGINRTLDMVASKYYWPGLSKDVKLYVSCLYDSTVGRELLVCEEDRCLFWLFIACEATSLQPKIHFLV